MQWLANVYSGLAGLFAAQPRAAAPGTVEHHELRASVRREFLEERAKPPEQRDPERVVQLRIQELRLGIEECETRASTLEANCPLWQVTATCCLGGSLANERMAASYAARAKYYRTRQRQAQEELSAFLERRPARLVALSRLELPEGVVQEMRRVPAMDLCAACHRNLEAAEAREDILRRHGQEIAEEYRRVGLLRAREQRQPEESAPKRRREPPVAGAVVAASKQQQEQQQGAPASDAPTGVLALQQRLQLRGSSSEEHEVEEAAGGEQAAALQAAQAPLLHSRRRRQDAAAAF